MSDDEVRAEWWTPAFDSDDAVVSTGALTACPDGLDGVRFSTGVRQQNGARFQRAADLA